MKKFNLEADNFDERIRFHVDGYDEMQDTIIGMLPFQHDKNFKLLDLGVGTGSLEYILLGKYPGSTVFGIDFSEEMLKMAKTRLKKYGERVKLIKGDFDKIVLDMKYDLIISCLSIHHLPNKRKKILYKHLSNNLKKGGYLIISDMIKSPYRVYTNKYISLRKQKLIDHGFDENYIDNHYCRNKYINEDIPSLLSDHIKWMKEAGLKNVECFWKKYLYAVFGGIKK